MLAPIKKLGHFGVTTPEDYPSAELPPPVFTVVDSVGFRDGKVGKLPGFYKRIFDFTEDVFWFHAWDDGAGVQSVAFGAIDTIYTTTDGQYVREATIAGTALSSSDDWQSDTFGSFCVMNNSVDPPKYSSSYNAGTDVWTFDDLPGWGDPNAPSGGAVFVRSFANHLVAGGVDGSPYTIFCSTRGDPETIPAHWDTADVTGLARSIPLQSKDGPVVDGGVLGDRFMVYQRYAVTALELSNQLIVMAARRLPFNAGLASRDAWVEFEGRHFVVGENAIAIHDGFNIQRVDDNKVRTFFFGELSDITRVKVTRDDTNHEIIVYYPTGEGDADRKMLYNWLENTWTFETIGEEVVRIAPAVIPQEPYTWDELTMPWDELTMSWTELNRTSYTSYLYQLENRSLQRTGTGYTREVGEVAFALEIAPDRILIDGAAGSGDRLLLETGERVEYDAWAERGHLDIDELLNGDDSPAKSVSGVYLTIRGAGIVAVQFGGSDRVDGTVRWDQEIEVDLDNDASLYVDIRTVGRYLHWRVGSWGGAARAGNWELASVSLELDLEGYR